MVFELILMMGAGAAPAVHVQGMQIFPDHAACTRAADAAALDDPTAGNAHVCMIRSHDLWRLTPAHTTDWDTLPVYEITYFKIAPHKTANTNTLPFGAGGRRIGFAPGPRFMDAVMERPKP
jgi:hypothetical protein